FISPDEGERLPLFFDDDNLEIRDPYDLQHVNNKTISYLCYELLYEEILTKSNVQKAEIKSLIDEKIFYVLDRFLWDQKISKKQWIKYLRKKLNDYNKLKALPTKFQIDVFCQKFRTNDVESCVGSYVGSLVMWKVSTERVIQAFWKNFYSNTWEFIDSIEPNDQFKLSSKDSEFMFNFYILAADEYIEKIQKYEKRLLPAPNFDFIIINCEQLHVKGRYFFKELLDDYIEDSVLIKLYGQELLKFTTIQNNNWDGTIEKPFIPNTLLKIIDKDEAKDKDNLFQKLRKIEEKVQELTDNEMR
ncbi:21730_t:CDS:2, partial [Cetraspora pellucida]